MNNGISDTSIADICKRSNASIGSIYHHFKIKEQLSATVYLEVIKNYHNGFSSTLKNELPRSKLQGINNF